MSDLFAQSPESSGDDPFLSLAMTPEERAALAPAERSAKVQTTRSMDDWHEGVDAELAPPKKRKKKVDHRQRTRELLEGYGYSVTLVEKTIRFRSGRIVKTDLNGLWDLQCMKAGQPPMYVQICGNPKDVQAHLRMMTSDKIALDNKKPRLVNLRDALASNSRCVIVSWEKQSNGRYTSSILKITDSLVDEYVERKKK